MGDLFNNTNVNTIGLAFDLVGIILVAYSFKNIRREKDAPGLFAGDDDYLSQQQKEHKRLILLDRIGMSFLFIGFVLQIISNYI